MPQGGEDDEPQRYVYQYDSENGECDCNSERERQVRKFQKHLANIVASRSGGEEEDIRIDERDIIPSMHGLAFRWLRPPETSPNPWWPDIGWLFCIQ